mgnify:CR=1 FL=1
MNNEILTAKEVAKLLRLKTRTVQTLASQGKLPGMKIGKQWRFRRSEIDSIFGRDISVA